MTKKELANKFSEKKIVRIEFKVAENFNMEEKEIMKVKEKIEDFLYGSD